MKEAANAAAVLSPDPREEVRNRLLRRGDWRFLLPDPSPRKTICFARGELWESVKFIFKSVADGRDGGSDRDCNLAVAVDPDLETLSRARSSLRPGGVLYSEWRGFFRRGKASVRRRLESAGFERVTLYWPHPDPSVASPEAWISLQERSSLRHYFVENRGRSRTALRRVGRRALRAAFMAAPGLRMAHPLCALAHKPSAPEEEPSRGWLDRFIEDRWTNWQPNHPPGSRSWLLLTGGLRSQSKVIALLFVDSSRQPVIALKIPRTQESAPSVRKEADVLRALLDRHETSTPPGIPRFLFLEDPGEIPVLGETAYTGVPLLSAWNANLYESLAMKASLWLSDLAGRRSPSPPGVWWQRLVGSALEEFRTSFGRAVHSRLLDESERLLKTLPPLPIVCEQRDFSPWNILLTDSGQLAVVDWESAELDGLPALDLIYFLTHFCFSLDSVRRTGLYRESYRRMLDPRTAGGAIAARCFSTYCERVGLDRSTLHPLRLLTWLVHSRSEFRRLEADFGKPPSLAMLQNAVCVQLWQEELRDDRAD